MLSVKNISFSYTKTQVIKDISFTVTKGQNIAIMGESGCGKSTLLKLIYGLHDLDTGEIAYNLKPVLGPKYRLVPGVDNMKYLAQDFDLMPFITVAENVGKFISNVDPVEKRRRIDELLEVVEMTEYADVMVKTLSGGEQQRVALARAIGIEPEVLLLDEPFNHIDNFRKNALRRNLFAYLKARQVICLVATHDCTDALSFADEIIVLHRGEMVAKKPTLDIYFNPPNKYAASLFGEVNEIKQSQLSHSSEGEDKILLLYPHQLKVSEDGVLKAVVKQSYFKGSNYLIKAIAGRKDIFFEHDTALSVSEDVLLRDNR